MQVTFPATLKTAPLPALKSGQSVDAVSECETHVGRDGPSMTATAATAASMASPPSRRTSWPALSARASAARYSARCSDVEPSRSIVPAPPWMTRTKFCPAASRVEGGLRVGSSLVMAGRVLAERRLSITGRATWRASGGDEGVAGVPDTVHPTRMSWRPLALTDAARVTTRSCD